jgi:hypothetical protein
VFAGAEPGPTVHLRCELDALPIQESNRFAHRSAVNGVAHLCGHDGHMAIPPTRPARGAPSSAWSPSPRRKGGRTWRRTARRVARRSDPRRRRRPRARPDNPDGARRRPPAA